MMCWKDMTFCNSNCTNSLCGRHRSVVEEDTSRPDWFPVAWSDFSNTCPEYDEPLNDEGLA